MTDKTLKTDCCLLCEESFLYCFLLTSTSCIFHFKTSPKALDPKKTGTFVLIVPVCQRSKLLRFETVLFTF